MDELNPFPLLRLPPNAMKNVLRIMPWTELAVYSFGTKLMNQHVRSLNYSSPVYMACFRDDVPRRHIYAISIGTAGVIMQEGFDRIYFFDYLEEGKHIVSQEFPGFHPNDCLRHMLQTFKRVDIEALFFRAEAGLNMESVKATVGDIPCNRLQIQETDGTHTGYMIRNFVPKHELWIVVNQEVANDGMIGNLRLLRIQNATHLKLDQLLMCNAQHVVLADCQMASKYWNQFLKCWKKGSTPNLVRLYADYAEPVLSEEAVLQGIAGRRMADGETRELLSMDQLPEFRREIIRNGFEIRRYDGTKALVHIQSLANPSRFKFFVFH